jgi:hypothetical protein
MDQSIDFKARALGSCTYGASWVVSSQLNAALIPNFCIFDGVNPVRTDYCDQARKARKFRQRFFSLLHDLERVQRSPEAPNDLWYHSR